MNLRRVADTDFTRKHDCANCPYQDSGARLAAVDARAPF
jgi:hypothetical protein